MCIAEMKDFLGLVGVLIGFALGAGYQEFRERGKRKRLRRQLSEEVRANLYSIAQKKATLRSILVALRDRRILPGTSVPFCEIIYSHHYPAVAPYLSLKERNLLQVVYSTLRTVDDTMSQFEPAVTAAGAGDPQERVMIAYAHKLADMLPALDEQELLMQSFLRGDPIDVFHMDMALDDLKKAEIRKG
jgi:hypothetical protein